MVATKTTKEIIEDVPLEICEMVEYAKKEWVSLDELREVINKLRDYHNFSYYRAKYNDALDDIEKRFFGTRPAGLDHSTSLNAPEISNTEVSGLAKSKEGLSKEVRSGDKRKVECSLPEGSPSTSSLASHNCSIKNSQHECCLMIKKIKKMKK